MAKFSFNLQSVLNIKVKMEEQKKIELGNANKELFNEKEILRKLTYEKTKFVKEFYDKNNNVVKAKDLLSLNVAIKYYNDEIVEQKIRIEKAEKKVEIKREELKKAVIEKKTFESLKEKALLDFMENLKKDENMIVDEIVSYKYNSNQ